MRLFNQKAFPDFNAIKMARIGMKKSLVIFLLFSCTLTVSAAEISGMIHHDGSPVTNVVISVLVRVDSEFSSHAMSALPFGTVIDVASNGAYVIDISSGSNYVVRVTPDVTTGLLPLYYLDAHSSWNASLIVTTDNSPVTNINFDLQQGVEVSGLVLADSIGFPEARVWVDNGSFSASSKTDSNGFYKVLVAPGSNYTARVNPRRDSGFLGEYYSNAVSSSDALAFSATLGFPATHINFDMEPAARISGTIFAGSNTVSEVFVTAYQKMDQWYQYVEGGTVSSNGMYSVWVPPGSNYLLKVFPYRDTAFLPEYYNGAYSQEEAELLSVFVEAPLEDINFDLDPGAWISGVVMSGTHIEGGARVQVQKKVYDGGTSNWIYTTVGSDFVDLLGGYSILVPPGTNYVVFAALPLEYPFLSFSPSRGFYYDAAHLCENALIVSATLDTPAEGIDFDLGRLPVISGKVMSEEIPLVGATVDVFHETVVQSSSNGWMSASLIRFVASVEVEADGSYAVRLSPGSNYLIRAEAAPLTPFLPEYYNNTRSSSDAERFSLSLDGSETNVNFDLSVGFRIQGTVNTEEGNAVRSHSISVYGSSARRANQVSGNTDGSYSIYAPTGELVRVSASGFSVRHEYYSNSWTYAGATAFSGETGDVVTANFVLFRSDADRDGDGLPDYQEEAVPDGIYQPGVDPSNLNVGDTDQDGVNDYHEKICKTDPANRSDYLYISDSIVSPDEILLRWPSVDQVAYCVERCSNLLTHEWEEISELINGDGSVLQFTDRSALGIQAFYRIRVLDSRLP